MMDMKYMPRVFCVECGKPATNVFRIHESKSNRRYIIVRCHGERQEIEFADQPNTEVRLWDKKSKLLPPPSSD